MQGQEYSQVGERTMRLKRVDPVSVAKVLGVLYAILGLIGGAIMALMSLVGATIGGGRQGGLMGLVFGVGGIVFVPIFYGIIGFIGGLISALIYNLVANVVGGIEMVVE